jgi:hypothetical protein
VTSSGEGLKKVETVENGLKQVKNDKKMSKNSCKKRKIVENVENELEMVLNNVEWL